MVTTLSAHELSVLRLAASGLTNEEIASNLRISVATVEAHKCNGMRKTGLKDQEQLIALAWQEGWFATNQREGVAPRRLEESASPRPAALETSSTSRAGADIARPEHHGAATPEVLPVPTSKLSAHQVSAFPAMCPACRNLSGVAIRAAPARTHGSIDTLVHCGSCHHEWLIPLPDPKRS